MQAINSATIFRNLDQGNTNFPLINAYFLKSFSCLSLAQTFGVLLKSYRFNTLLLMDLTNYSIAGMPPVSIFSTSMPGLTVTSRSVSRTDRRPPSSKGCSQAGPTGFSFCEILPIRFFRSASSRLVTVPFSNNTSPPTMVRITSEALAEWTMAVTGEKTGRV